MTHTHTNSCDKLIAGSCILAFTVPGTCEEKGERRVTHAHTHTSSCDKLIAGSCIFAFTVPDACEEKGKRRVTHTNSCDKLTAG